MNEDILNDLRQAYDNNAIARDAARIDDWKRMERDDFLTLLQKEGKQSVLDLGCGTGRDGLHFKNHGLAVTCVDLSPENVRLCREKGLCALEMDMQLLDLPEMSFDAVYALNSLLHVQKAVLPGILATIKDLMKPDGLFFMGVYGGSDFEGYLNNDWATPKRFFSFYSDADLRDMVSRFFTLISFKTVQIIDGDPYHFQAMVLRKEIR